MYWSKRAYLIALLAEELHMDITKYEDSNDKYLCNGDITKNALQADIKKIRRELLKLLKSLDL